MNKENKTLSDVLYPPVVTAHINKTMEDYFKWRVNNKNEVQMHYSSQPNGHPHLGTMTSVMTAFAIGNFLQESFHIPAHLAFEQLENAPGYKIKKNDVTYQLMLCDTPLENSTKLDVYMKSFKGLMNRLSKKSGIEYKILSYKDFQETPFVRESLIEILNREKRIRAAFKSQRNEIKGKVSLQGMQIHGRGCKNLKCRRRSKRLRQAEHGML